MNVTNVSQPSSTPSKEPITSPSVSTTNGSSTGTRPLKCHKSRSAEWAFFSDEGRWNESSHRIAKCLYSSVTKGSKRETLKTHIKSCALIPHTTREACLESSQCFRPNQKGTGSKASSSLFCLMSSKLTKTQLVTLEELALRAAISTNSSFHSLENYDFLKALQYLNVSVTMPTGQTFSDGVLDRVHRRMTHQLRDVYREGCSVTVSVDGWKAPNQRKWVGVCCVLRSLSEPRLLIDLSTLKDVTREGENDKVIEEIIAGEINKLDVYMKQATRSSLVAVVTDSASCNVSAKKRLSESHEKVTFLACFADQLNLMAGNILTHPSFKQTVTDAKKIVSFFNTHSAHKSVLQKKMEENGGSFEFIVECHTRWYTNFGMTNSIYVAAPVRGGTV